MKTLKSFSLSCEKKLVNCTQSILYVSISFYASLLRVLLQVSSSSTHEILFWKCITHISQSGPRFFTWADEWTMKLLSAKVCYSIIIVSHQLAVLMGHISSSVAEKKFYFSKLTRETWREVKVGMSLRYVIPYALLVCITLDNIIILYHSRTLRTLN